MSRRWLLVVTSLLLCQTLATTAAAQNSTARSLFGNWFGRKESSSSQQDNRYQTRITDAPSQSATQANNQLPPDPAIGTEVLPGLGGSPLPKKATPSTNNPTGKNGLAAPSLSPSTQQNSIQKENPPSQSPRQSPSHSLNMSAAPSTPANRTTTPPLAAPRQSPSRRTATHLNPNDLRNELSGSFPTPVDMGEPTVRTARAGNSVSKTETNEEKTATVTEPSSTSIAPAITPIKDQPVPAMEKSATIPQQVEQPKPEAQPAEREPQNAADAFSIKSEPRASVGASKFVRSPYANSPMAGPQTTRGKEAFGEALQVASGGDPNLLASNQTPILTSDIRGPKQILIGREAVYRVRLQNQSDITAEGIVATVTVPTGADVVNATASQGTVQPPQDAQAKGQMQWQIARMDRHASETLEIRIIPRENRPLELGVNWTVTPVGSRAIVEVQEPKLQLEVAGPTEVFFDKPQVFKLTISNPGTGPAENVRIELMPPSGKETATPEATTSHSLGDLPAGGSQTVEVELTPREAGKLFVKAIALAEGGLTSNASKEVLCRKPELEVDWRGPATKYSGTLATFFVRVRNPGTAPADDVTVRVALPEGTEFTSASEGQAFDTKTREVAWHVGTLRPGDDNYMELKCVLKAAGANQLKITAATATGNLTDTKTASTNVIAIADLKLDVSDPSGPVAVGTPAVYEIHIKNRGASAAKDVTVVGLFSEGIEPEQAEGAMYTVADGRVSFKTVDIAAGEDIALKIRAHALQPGTHIFRAEVLCRDLEIKLAAEETTRFYNDEATPDAGNAQTAGRDEGFKPAPR